VSWPLVVVEIGFAVEALEVRHRGARRNSFLNWGKCTKAIETWTREAEEGGSLSLDEGSARVPWASTISRKHTAHETREARVRASVLVWRSEAAGAKSSSLGTNIRCGSLYGKLAFIFYLVGVLGISSAGSHAAPSHTHPAGNWTVSMGA
jgi:hypothetical protein